MRFVVAGVAALVLGCSQAADWPVQHVVHVSVDGLGAIYLKAYLEQSSAEFPTFARLRSEGSSTFNARCDYDNSFTEPNHTSMFTGRPVLEQTDGPPPGAPHLLTVNYDPGDPWTLHNFAPADPTYRASVFDVVHDHGRSTAFFAAKQKFQLFLRSYDAVHGAPDDWHSDQGRDKIDSGLIIDWAGPQLVRANDSNLVSVAVALLATNAPNYLFLHLADPDITGHYYLWGSESYREAVREVDRQLGRLLTAIDSNPRLVRRTVFLLTTDHGGGDSAGSHIYPHELPVFTIPMFLWGPGVPVSRDLYELFSNRRDPGTTNPDYSAADQPLRNGDTGNLALQLLGLPLIPSSSLVPRLRPLLFFTPLPDGGTLAWSDSFPRCRLEYCTDLTGSVWTVVSEGMGVRNGVFEYHVSRLGDNGRRFFRLRETPAQ